MVQTNSLRGFGWRLKEFQKDELARSTSCNNCCSRARANRHWFFIATSYQLIVPPNDTPEALINLSPLPLTLLFCLDGTTRPLARRLVSNHKSSPPDGQAGCDVTGDLPRGMGGGGGRDELLPPAWKTAECLSLPPSLPWPFEIIKITLAARSLCHFIVNRCSLPFH